jgi:hypothetical protein
MIFEDWIKTFPEPLDAPSVGFARKVWQAAQAAERERTIALILKHTQKTPFDWTKAMIAIAHEINEESHES